MPYKNRKKSLAYFKKYNKKRRKTMRPYYRAYYRKRRDQGKWRYNAAEHIRMIRNLLLQRDGGLCGICQKPLGDDLSIDHIISVRRGGTEAADNLRLTHRKCNARKSSK